MLPLFSSFENNPIVPIAIKEPIKIMLRIISRLIILALGFLGGVSMTSCSFGSKDNGITSKPSVTKLIHRICTALKISGALGKRIKAERIVIMRQVKDFAFFGGAPAFSDSNCGKPRWLCCATTGHWESAWIISFTNTALAIFYPTPGKNRT